MNGEKRLSSLADIGANAAAPAYDPQRHGTGIVHLGVGAFHRAHQAVYTDQALAQEGGDWRIAGVSLRSVEIADALNRQNGLYTLLERGPAGTKARVIAAIASVIAARREPGMLLPTLSDPAIRVVTTTVTEKAYGIDRATGSVDPSHPAIAGDLANPRQPTGAVGLIVESLRQRRENGTAPFTVLCCDNLPANGKLLRGAVVDFARRKDADLAAWIAHCVAFPSCMVDRITPATTSNTLADAKRLTGCVDLGAIETEPFSHWIIEDRFTAGRPAWESGGALFVQDVEPYELMKLRMLNGSHSMLAYAGFLAGHRYVRDAMADVPLRRLVERHILAAASTLPPVPAIDLGDYRRALLTRFENPAIAHETYQIAMDGTEKLPQRIFATAVDAAASGKGARPFAFAVAAWMRYCLGRRENGETYSLRDPRQEQIQAALSGRESAAAISDALHGLSGYFPQALANSREWRREVETVLGAILENGMAPTIQAEADER
jgi:fructuronate reductase